VIDTSYERKKLKNVTDNKFVEWTAVLATTNPGKIDEMREILSLRNIEVVTREQLGITIDVEETGTTFFENAKIKAEAICGISGLPAIADDSGLIVEALDGGPGVYSSSFGGENITAAERCAYLLKRMENMEQRRAKFVCIIVCVFPDGGLLTAHGECNGRILTAPRGTGGFGYDPVFKPDGKDRTLAELSAEEKNAISHRGNALRTFAELLEGKLGERA
jgi:XTP/dITP diphosphohydrolase